MATTNQCAAAFMARLLAPLPATEEPVDHISFRRLILRDNKMVWANAMEAVRIADAHRVLAWAAFQKSGERYVTDGKPAGNAVLAACEALGLAKKKQALIPAPTMKELRWKRREMPHDPSDEVRAMMEADAIRLNAKEDR